MLKTISAFFISFSIFFLSQSIALAQTESPVIIKYKETTTSSQRELIEQKYNLKSLKNLDKLNIEIINATDQKISSLLQEKGIEYIEPDAKAYAVGINDPLFSQQWGISKIQSDSAWDMVNGKPPVTVAIVDTGINSSHPDLAGRVVGGTNFTSDPDGDRYGHGTHVAGIVSALTNNGVGVAGVSGSNLLSVKVLSDSGYGYYSDVASGIIWAADHGARVINLSLGGTSSSRALQEAVDYAWSKGAVIVIAAGNNNSSSPFYPAYYSNAIAVGATDQSDGKASFSNYGTWVDIAAPGVGILSTYDNDYRSMSGTSMASPFVAGVASIILANHPDWSNSQVRQKLFSSTDNIAKARSWTVGRVNACKAVDCSGSTGQPSPSPTASPSPTSSPFPTPQLLTVQGFNGEYFKNQNLTGTPVFTRIDPAINFDWGTKSPDKSIPISKFSVRWTATITPQDSQNYTFTTVTDDGVRLWIGDQLIIDNWDNQRVTTNKGTVNLNANQSYNLKMEYFEYSGRAQAKLSW